MPITVIAIVTITVRMVWRPSRWNDDDGDEDDDDIGEFDDDVGDDDVGDDGDDGGDDGDYDVTVVALGCLNQSAIIGQMADTRLQFGYHRHPQHHLQIADNLRNKKRGRYISEIVARQERQGKMLLRGRYIWEFACKTKSKLLCGSYALEIITVTGHCNKKHTLKETIHLRNQKKQWKTKKWCRGTKRSRTKPSANNLVQKWSAHRSSHAFRIWRPPWGAVFLLGVIIEPS